MFHLKRRRRERIGGRVFPDGWVAILDRIPLVGRLPDDDRPELQRHVQVLLTEKRFEGVGGLTLDDGVRLTIAAQAGVLLLHRDTDYFPKLHSIIVYPSVYEARIEEVDDLGVVVEDDESRAGETWLQGSLVLSWEDIVADGSESDGELNVILHEFTHQLDAETGEMNGLPRIAAPPLRAEWGQVMSDAYERHVSQVDAGRATVLDPYGAEDPAEFFAVAVEAFFQQPLRLRAAAADLYRVLSSFFAQDPACWPARRCESMRPD